MIKECNFKIISKPDMCELMKYSPCPGEDNCILYQIYEKLDIIEIIKGHEKTLSELAKH